MTTRLSEDLKFTLTQCFSTDQALLDTWHIESGKGLTACVNRTTKDLTDINIEVFELIEDEEVVGYFGVEASAFLTGFFLKPEYRTRQHVTAFWNEVDSHFGPSYFVGLYDKNLPAKAFVLKRGVAAINVPELEGTLYLIEKE